MAAAAAAASAYQRQGSYPFVASSSPARRAGWLAMTCFLGAPFGYTSLNPLTHQPTDRWTRPTSMRCASSVEPPAAVPPHPLTHSVQLLRPQLQLCRRTHTPLRRQRSAHVSIHYESCDKAIRVHSRGTRRIASESSPQKVVMSVHVFLFTWPYHHGPRL